MKTPKDNKGKFGKAIVIVVLVQVFLYTWVHLILSAVVGMEIAPTTSVAFYSFCGAEAGLLAFIRKIKQDRDKTDKQEGEEHEGTDYSEVDEP